jgi:hypothetical protein
MYDRKAILLSAYSRISDYVKWRNETSSGNDTNAAWK